jgi:hypothetical protein
MNDAHDKLAVVFEEKENSFQSTIGPSIKGNPAV